MMMSSQVTAMTQSISGLDLLAHTVRTILWPTQGTLVGASHDFIFSKDDDNEYASQVTAVAARSCLKKN